MWLGSCIAVSLRSLASTAPIRPLAWEPLYGAGEALEKAKRHTKKLKIKKDKTQPYAVNRKQLLILKM